MKSIATLILILIVMPLGAQVSTARYAFNRIPDELKIGANAVYRTDEMLFTVQGPSKAVKKRKVAITLLNETAEHYRYPEVHYGKFEKVNYIKASVYNEKGQLVDVLRSTDILDISAVGGGSFHSDARVKIIRFPIMRYPYTIEYEYETQITGLISYPTWHFQRSRYASVEKSGVQYVVPKDVKVKFRELYLTSRDDSLVQKDNVIYTWRMENIPATRLNPYINLTHNYPRIYSTPLDFQIDGYKGSTASWEAFGDWNFRMIEGRDKLPDEEVKRVRNLVKDIVDERQRVKVIYEYMQSRTRYVSISLGIGGWQPMTATEVSNKGYGDCKALTNYTMSLLRALGIESFYTLVRSGRNENINPNFVSNQFDHVILCVPQPNDTIWLECTSQILPFNYLSDFTSNRYVLITGENGGRIARTPAFSMEDNVVRRTGTIQINHIAGITKADITTTSSGRYFSSMQGAFTHQSEEGMKRYLNNTLNIHTFDVDWASIDFIKSEKPSSMLGYQLSVRNFAVQSQSRLFFTPSLIKADYLVNTPVNIRIHEPSNVSDSLTYIIPYGYIVEHIPESHTIETKFGIFRYSINSFGNKIEFQRSLELFSGTYVQNEFNEFYEFINAVATADRERIILRKRGT